MISGTLPFTRPQHTNFVEFWTRNLKPVAYGGFLALFFFYLLVTRFIKYSAKTTERPNSPDPEKSTFRKPSFIKAPERPPGVWTPVDFKRPKAAPLLDWDVRKTEPLPYRPFRYGPYHITMGLRTMQWDDWIELDNHYLKFHAEKARRIKDRGEACCRTAPEAMDGAIELLEEL